MKLPVETQLLEAADGNVEQIADVKRNLLIVAEKMINDEQLDQYVPKDDLLKCAVLGMEKLLNFLQNHQELSKDTLARNANYRALHVGAYREMIVFVKCAYRKDPNDYLDRKRAIQHIIL